MHENAPIVLGRGGLWTLPAEDNHARRRGNACLRAVVTLSLGQPRSWRPRSQGRACPQRRTGPGSTKSFGIRIGEASLSMTVTGLGDSTLSRLIASSHCRRGRSRQRERWRWHVRSSRLLSGTPRKTPPGRRACVTRWTTAYWRIGSSEARLSKGCGQPARTLMVCGRARVVVHSRAASTGHMVCTAHVRGEAKSLSPAWSASDLSGLDPSCGPIKYRRNRLA